VLSRGLLSGFKPAGQGDFRTHLPRFAGENRERNQRLIERIQKIAAEKGLLAPEPKWLNPWVR
jgi:aryl-alcohol dehydrogenase-like predicted oxidoreductase